MGTARAPIGILPDGTASDCPKCSEPRIVKSYSNGRKVAYCSPCAVRSTATWKKRYPDNAKAHLRATYNRRTYGLTPDEFDALVDASNRQCRICLVAFSDEQPPCIDHCHSTDRIRGVLCRQCNLAIGNLRDDVALVLRAADYLMQFEDVIEAVNDGNSKWADR